MLYSDLEFTNEVNDKFGNIKFFRSKLREIGKLEERQKLDEQHVDLFKKVREYRETYGCTWERAMDEALAQAFPDATTEEMTITDMLQEQTAIIKELLERVKRIEERMN